jgi:peroxiredoxin
MHDRNSFPFPVVVDQDSRIASAYGSDGLLFTKRTVYVIDRDGKILLAERGVVPHDRIFAALDRP